MPQTSNADRLADAVEAELQRRANGGGTGLKPLWDADQLRSRLRQYDRTPFLSLLQQFIEHGPTDDAVARLAEKYPEKWVTALTQLARIGGFTEKTEQSVNINVAISQMSDSQLEDQLKHDLATLGIVDADFEEVDALTPALAGPTPDASSD